MKKRRSNTYGIIKEIREIDEQSNQKTLKEVMFKGLKAGATGILGAVLNMCNTGKTVGDIKDFCVKSLNMDGMKN